MAIAGKRFQGKEALPVVLLNFQWGLSFRGLNFRGLCFRGLSFRGLSFRDTPKPCIQGAPTI